jgi:hypothetical protein
MRKRGKLVSGAILRIAPTLGFFATLWFLATTPGIEAWGWPTALVFGALWLVVISSRFFAKPLSGQTFATAGPRRPVSRLIGVAVALSGAWAFAYGAHGWRTEVSLPGQDPEGNPNNFAAATLAFKWMAAGGVLFWTGMFFSQKRPTKSRDAAA